MNRSVPTDVVRLRYAARKVIADKVNCHDELRQLERQRRKLEQDGVSFILLDKRIEVLKAHNRQLFDTVAELGRAMCTSLDKWQATGASLKDLCDLCAIPYDKAVREIEPHDLNQAFSELIFVHNLDYKHSNSDFIEWEVDAPLTHCIKEYHIHLLETTPGMMDALRPGLLEIFPEIAQSREHE